LVPSFLEHHKKLTAAAARTIAEVYQSLVERSAAPLDEIQRFMMQVAAELTRRAGAEEQVWADGGATTESGLCVP